MTNISSSSTTTKLSQWIHRNLGQKDTKIVHRIRGNILHILCEGAECPPMEATLQKLKTALDVTDTNTLPPEISDQATSPIYQIILYGRKRGYKHPDWSVSVVTWEVGAKNYPNPFQGLKQGLKPSIEAPREARQGKPEAIARYLSEILSPFGVGVRVQVRPLKTAAEQSPGVGQPEALNPTKAQKRLWVFCTCAYSPDPELLTEPLAQRLRHLHLEGFRDAVILGQVTGETKPEWLLRIDLTPPEQLLAAWARWGDIPALTRLLEQKLTPLGLQVSGVIEDSTLHLFFSKSSPGRPKRGTNYQGQGVEPLANQGFSANSLADSLQTGSSDKETVKACIQPVLESLAPQGIIGATLYGQLAEESPPVWVDWLDLPASRHVELAGTVLDRAAKGDLEAITFLLDRQLNPDLDRKLQTGGMQVTIRRVTKATLGKDILHVLVDIQAANLYDGVEGGDYSKPLQGLKPGIETKKLANLIANLKIEGLTGVRIYGRVCGRVQPLWRYKVDFADKDEAIKQRETELEPAADFQNTSASSPDFLPEPPQTVLNSFSGAVNDELGLQSFLTKQPPTALKTATADAYFWFRRLLIATHAFLPAKSVPTAAYSGPAVTLVWLILGLLALVQADWFLASLFRGRPSQWADAPHFEAGVKAPLVEEGWGDGGSVPASTPVSTPISIPERDSFISTPVSIPVSIPERDSGKSSPHRIPNSTTETRAQTANKPDFSFSYPTFNSQQLDEQLANYFRYVADGGPADVLIVGSSRALRGVDPSALEKALGTNRPGLRVFNFGINGATAQVVEWLLRDLLAPEYLPKLILWADGARAFNSGRADRTMEAIIASPGNKALQLGHRPTIPNPHTKYGDNADATAKPKIPHGLNLAAAYDELDAFFASKLTSLSASYKHRSDLLKLLSTKIRIHGSGLPGQFLPTPGAEAGTGDGGEGGDALPRGVVAPTEVGSQPEPGLLEGQGQANGFLPISQKFDPYTYYDQYALVTGTYDADYQSFQLLGKQDEALQNILKFVGERDINLVFINTPLTMGYLDSVRLAYEREFQQYILALAMKHQFLFKDFSELWPTQNDYFSDPSHLNRFGAAEVSRKLADDALISWPTTKESLPKDLSPITNNQ